MSYAQFRLPTLMVVEDDPTLATLCSDFAENEGFRVCTSNNLMEAFKQLATRDIDVVLVDIALPDGNGFRILEHLRSNAPRVFSVVMTGSAAVSSAVQAVRAGASDYLQKPFALSELRAILGRAKSKLGSQCPPKPEVSVCGSRWGPLLSGSVEMLRVFRLGAKVSQLSQPLVISGEFGTGRELLAKTIHNFGSRAHKPCIIVDCDSADPSQLGQRLFGNNEFKGIASTVAGGTLVLRDIEALPLDLQVKMLRLLRSYVDLPQESDEGVRIIAIANSGLDRAVLEGRFRRDLYAQLSGVALRLPALRDRREDVPILANWFLQHFARSGEPLALSPDAQQSLINYDWPNNVAELKALIEQSAMRATGLEIRTLDLPREIQHYLTPKLPQSKGIMTIAELEKQAIIETMKSVKGDKVLAAKMLGIGKTTLYRKLKDYGLLAGYSGNFDLEMVTYLH